MGHLSENAYRMAFYLFYRARKAPVDDDGIFRVKIQDIIHYIGLPTKEDVKNRNYDEAIIRPLLAGREALLAATEIRHTDVTIAMDAKPSQAVRTGRRTSSTSFSGRARSSGACGTTTRSGSDPTTRSASSTPSSAGWS